MKFKDFYDSLPTKREKQSLRNEIIQHCCIQFSTFYSWNAREKYPPLAQQKIAELTKLPILELFPLETINK